MNTIDEFFKREYGIDTNEEINNMSRERFIKALNILDAVVKGKTVQQADLSFEWVDVVVEIDSIPKLLFTAPEQFRVKPEPTYRAWQLAEVPIGAVARRKNPNATRIPQVIVAADITTWKDDTADQVGHACAIMHFENRDNTRTDRMLRGWEWKWAHEPDTAWRVCGVPT